MLYDKRWNKTAAPIKIAPWRRLLLKAARILERDGWCQNNLYWRTRSCAIGALNRADSGHPGYEGVHSAVWVEAHNRLRAFVGGHNGSIEAWNDTVGRTGSQVIATMRKVAGA